MTSSREYIVPWGRAEADVGFRLPGDYKELVQHFGPGDFDEFLEIRVPGIANPNRDLASQSRKCFKIQRDLIDRRIGEWPYPYPGSPGSLLNWGGDANGNFYYWKTAGHPDSWITVVQPARGDDFFEYSGNMSEFLFRYLAGDLYVDFLPPPEEGDTLTFDPSDGSWHGEEALEAYGRFGAA
ncbi:SMI1/KNR4 family protein [Streptomonospora algeriensis]|uniref:SMI1/KNR4 family protein n=1 Tax=Streptomonospora algeriensis TaxID=995084 RepID=A0ABW3B8R4_9ACTN